MRVSAVFLAILFFFLGTAPAAPVRLDFYSKLDLPIYSSGRPARLPSRITSAYIGSDKSYAAESKEVQVVGRSLNVGLAVAGLLQPLGPVFAVGFLVIGVYNAKALVSALTSPPSRSSQWSFIWSKKRRKIESEPKS
jgi:hypothetical protein